MKPIAYFAHSKLDYGTKREKEALKFLEKHYKVLCPYRELKYFDRPGLGMDGFIHFVEWCDLVIVMEHKGKIGKGVLAEIKTAWKNNKHVFTYRENNLYLVTDFKVVNENDWKQYAILKTYK